MKELLHIMKFELKVIIRNKFHYVLLITLASVIGVYYLIPNGIALVPTFENTGRVIVSILNTAGNVSLRSTYLPVMLTFEVAILGYLFIAVTMFNEKEEGVIESYRMTPSGTIIYVLGKVFSWTLISTFYGVVLITATQKSGFNYLSIVSLIFMSTLFMTSLGLFVAIFFKNMSDWFLAGIGVMSINMMPQITSSISSFNPFWMKIFPGYHIFTGFNNIMGKPTADSLNIILGLAAATIIILIMTVIAAHLKLMRER